MKTRVIYLKGDVSDEAKLHEAEKQGFKLQSVVVIQGQAVGYLVREPWLDPQPILVQGPPINLEQPKKKK